jgi:hypothetical protein
VWIKLKDTSSKSEAKLLINRNNLKISYKAVSDQENEFLEYAQEIKNLEEIATSNNMSNGEKIEFVEDNLIKFIK